MTELRQLTQNDFNSIKDLFYKVFTGAPWFDDWSDDARLTAYITDLTGNRNSLAYGFYEDGELVGISLGSIRHWFSGTEYNIDELCILTERQGRGLGKAFVSAIEEAVRDRGIPRIFLQTDTAMPAYEFYKKLGFTELTTHVSFNKDL